MSRRGGDIASWSVWRLSLAEARLDQGQQGTGESFIVPHSVSLYGRLFDQGAILRIGAALEAKLNVASRRPPLAA